ncbi:hypothetical protein [Nisaea sp.]|uniref:hypothetical protein n=1 Tax=Nisaea sp. TaxID=2024842 RepID=UPI0032EF1EBF
MRRTLVLPVLIAAGLILSACADTHSTRQHVLSGGGIGTGLSPERALYDGCVTCGVGVGTGVGAGTVYLVD